MIGLLLLLVMFEFFALYYVQKASSEKDKRYLIITMLLYGIPISLLIYKLLEFRKIGTVNFSWNVLSSVYGLFIGIYFFKEKVINLQWLGVGLGTLGLGLIILSGKQNDDKNN
jgi:multidrug transporter EmrE-like cation transporter